VPRAAKGSTAMEGIPTILEWRSWRKATADFNQSLLWELFDGTPDRFNIATECLDRHSGRGIAVQVFRAGDIVEDLTFEELASWSSRFAWFLADRGVRYGDPVGIMIEPSLAFYAALFGTMKAGAVAVPLFTLFGPDAVDVRLKSSKARVLVVGPGGLNGARGLECDVVTFDEALFREIADRPDIFPTATAASDLAVLQFTSGTSKEIPDAVPHRHRSVLPLMLAAIFGLGLRPEDRYFCPSSPAWGHGLWHGTVAPWALGITTGSWAGRFEVGAFVNALHRFGATNLAAAGTVYRMVDQGGGDSLPQLAKATFTGEYLDPDSVSRVSNKLGTRLSGMYGTTETGVILANYPGFEDYEPRSAALGQPLPGLTVSVLDRSGRQAAIGQVGEIAVQRGDQWRRSRDLGWVDDEGYFWYWSRADDVIISAGWTISPFEVEHALCKHADVVEAAVIGIPDLVRGQILKAFVVSQRNDKDFIGELQQMVRVDLGQHEYPRVIEVTDSLPRTPNGKINRKALRTGQSHDIAGLGKQGR
jgi:acetyl-CoA synthetase